MEDKKEKMHPFFKLLTILFIIFTSFYIALISGYYPSRVEKKAIYTSKKIDEFESDIKNKDNVIQNNGYLNKEEDYSNFITKTGNVLTYSVGKLIDETSKGVKEVFKILFW